MVHDIPADLSDDTAARLEALNAAWSKATDLRATCWRSPRNPAERKLAGTQAWFDALTVVVTGLTEWSSQVAGAARISDPLAGEDIQPASSPGRRASPLATNAARSGPRSAAEHR